LYSSPLQRAPENAFSISPLALADPRIDLGPEMTVGWAKMRGRVDAAALGIGRPV